MGLQAFDLPKTLLSHATAWLLGGLIVLTLLRFGTAVVPRTRLHLFVAAFLAANVAATFVASDPYLASFGEQGRYLGLTFVIDMAVLYAGVAIAFRSRADLAALGVGVAVAALTTVGYAVVQYIGLDPVSWSADVTRAGGVGAAPFGTFGQPDFLAHFLAVVFAGALALAVTGGAMIYRLAGLAFVLVALAAALAVGSRGAAVGVAAAVIALALTTLRQRRGRLRPLYFTLFAVGAGALLVSVVIVLSNTRESDAWQGPGSGRLRLYESALRAFVDRPVLGYGPDSFAVAYPQYRLPTQGLASDAQTSAHNWPLQAAVTTGAVGLGTLVALVAAASWMAWRMLPRTRSALALLLCLAAYWTNALVATGAIAVDWIPWTVFGLVAASSAPTAGSVQSQRRVPTLLAAAIVVVMLVGAFSGVRAFRANEDAGIARSALIEGRIEAAIGSAQRAVTFDSGRADYWNWLGLALEADGRWPAAVDAYTEATRHARHEPIYWSNLALALAQRATREAAPSFGAEALRSARTAIEVDPTSWRANEVLAQVAAAIADDDLALEAACATIILEKGHGPSEEIAIGAARRVSDKAKAQRLLESALEAKESAALHVALGELALRSSDRASAHTHAARALELDPSREDAATLLANSR